MSHQEKEFEMKYVAAFVGLSLVAGTALAFDRDDDRAPTASERASVEQVLRAGGFVSWEEIELDDDGPVWDVDDARTRDGARYDVKIDPSTLRITRRQLDR